MLSNKKYCSTRGGGARPENGRARLENAALKRKCASGM
jgi:hypothetical protein